MGVLNMNKPVETVKYARLKKYIPDIINWVREGVTRADIAKNLQIAEKTMYNWIDKYPEFREAFDVGADLLYDDVEASLYKSTKIQSLEEKWYDENGEITKKFVKDIAPNQRAIEYVLNNRRPDKWKSDTQSIDISMSEKMREKLSGLNINDLVGLANMDIDSIPTEQEETETSEE